jgi:signal peptidase I
MRNNFKDFILEIIETFVMSLIVILVLYMWVALPEQVWGASMEPNFYTGERILVERVSKHFNGFERGDVVVLNPPGSSNIDYIKRIVALPGEMVKIVDCEVHIVKDGVRFRLDEPYLAEGMCTTGGPRIREGRYIRLEEKQYFVLGDNRTNSADSRYFGLVNEGDILGKAVLRFWPPDKTGFL